MAIEFKRTLGMEMGDWISQHFTLADLCVTETGEDNTPDDAALLNLQELAQVLDEIYDTIFPFDIESAYRSEAVKLAIQGGSSGADSAAQAASKSFHDLGMAADITPKMDARQFFAKLITSPIKDRLGEIAIKENTIHLSLATPSKQGVIMKVINNQYIRMQPDEITTFITNNLPAAVVVASSMGLAIGIAVLTFFIVKKMRSAK